MDGDGYLAHLRRCQLLVEVDERFPLLLLEVEVVALRGDLLVALAEPQATSSDICFLTNSNIRTKIVEGGDKGRHRGSAGGQQGMFLGGYFRTCFTNRTFMRK